LEIGIGFFEGANGGTANRVFSWMMGVFGSVVEHSPVEPPDA